MSRKKINKPESPFKVRVDNNGIYVSALKVDLAVKNLIVWDKGTGLGFMYMNCYELIWFFSNSPKHDNVKKRKKNR